MKRAPITSFHREAYGLVLEEYERRSQPLGGEPPKSPTGLAAGPPAGDAKLQLPDLALLTALVAGAVGFWILAGKLLVRAWSLLLALLS